MHSIRSLATNQIGLVDVQQAREIPVRNFRPLKSLLSRVGKMNRDLSLVTFTISSNTCIVQFDCAPLSYGRRTLSVHLFILPQYPPVPVFRKTIVPYIITVFIPPSTLPRTHAPALTSTATESDGSLNTKETAFDLVEFGASVPVGAIISVGLVDAK